jgi:NTP pyrophosphatase (non-canonical NTP hydrolase)
MTNIAERVNGLGLIREERLVLLAEELAEAGQAVCKILRHGYESRHPDGGPTNRETLERELGDVRAAVVLLLELGDLSDGRIEEFGREKYARVGRYLHYSKPGDKPFG